MDLAPYIQAQNPPQTQLIANIEAGTLVDYDKKKKKKNKNRNRELNAKNK
jgi:hypothetical protein